MSNKYGIIIPFVEGDQEIPKFFLSGYLRQLNVKQYAKAVQNIGYILVIDNQNKRNDIIEHSKLKNTIKDIIDFAKENNIPYGDLSKNIYTSIRKDESLEVKNNVDLLFHLANKADLQKKFLRYLKNIEEKHEITKWIIMEGDPKFGSLAYPKESLRNGSAITYPILSYNIGPRSFDVYIASKDKFKFYKEVNKSKHCHLHLADVLRI